MQRLMLCVLLAFTPAVLAQTTANDLLLNNDGLDPDLRSTATEVVVDRFVPGATTYTTQITDVRFCVDRLRTDVAVSSGIEPLAMERNGVEWFEYNLLVSGTGFSSTDVYPFGTQQGQSRDLNLRVQIPTSGWNGKLIFWHHGQAAIHMHAFSPLLEPELMLSRGFAVANGLFSGPVPAQQNPNAADGSFWKWIDEMFIADPGSYNSYSAHPDWWASDGSPLSDAANDRNLVNLAKNLIFVETGSMPAQTFWTGWSAGGQAGIALANGRDLAGNYTGGNYNTPYAPASGLVFDGFMAIAPVFIPSSPVDPVYPVTVPFIFIDGSTDQTLLSFPNALNFAHKVKDALLAPLADPSLSDDINDWVRLYMQRYGNHDWTGRFYEVLHSGADGSDDPAALYLDIRKPVATRLNNDGRGRKLNWAYTELAIHSPVYFGLWMDQEVSGWGQIASAYYQINDGYHLQLFNNLLEWVNDGTPPPRGRIDPYVYEPTAVDYPDLPQSDFTQDSLDRTRFPLAPFMADIEWQRTATALSLDVELSMVDSPHNCARTGVYYNGYKYFEIIPFTQQQLLDGYHVGNVDFAGYADNADYQATFRQCVQTLLDQDLFDPQIGAMFINNGDPAVRPPFIVDTDEDGIADLDDNCMVDANPDQRDADGDGIGSLCDGDLNNNCVVNFVDLGAMRAAYLSADPVADLNGSGGVNFVDLGILKSMFLGPPGPSGVPNICD